MTIQTPEQLSAAITALEAQRALLGDAIVDTALAPLREKLAALRAPGIAAAAQQLKQVSVLFVDVVGSTAMGQQLDPETIHEVTAAFRWCCRRGSWRNANACCPASGSSRPCHRPTFGTWWTAWRSPPNGGTRPGGACTGG